MLCFSDYSIVNNLDNMDPVYSEDARGRIESELNYTILIQELFDCFFASPSPTMSQVIYLSKWTSQMNFLNIGLLVKYTNSSGCEVSESINPCKHIYDQMDSSPFLTQFKLNFGHCF